MFNNSQKFLSGKQTKFALLGFTLIELLVIIAILGLLASIIFIGVSRAQGQARDSKRRGEVDAIRKALAIYETEQDNYPESSNWIKIEEDAENNGPFSQALQDYLPEMPKDPLWGQEKESGKPYSYQYTTGDTGGEDYMIHVEMETGEYASYETYSGDGDGISYDGGGEDQVQNCIDNSSAYVNWILNSDFSKVDKVRIGGLANDCSGLLLTVILSGDLPNDGCGSGADPELGRASSIIPDDGDNENKTTVDFVPDIPIEPIECIDVDVS